MGLPTFQNNGNNTIGGGVTTLTLAMPTGIVAGDVLIGFIVVSGGGRTMSVGAGWTLGDSATSVNGSAWAWRLAAGGDPGPVFSWTGTGANASGVVVRYNGTPSSFIGAFAKNTGSSATEASPGLTTTAANSTVVCFQGVANIGIASAPIYVQRFLATPGQGSVQVSDYPAYNSGSVASSISEGLASSQNWTVFEIELLGSGTTANEPRIRATQVTQQVLEGYTSTKVRASLVTIQVLRSQSNVTVPQPKSRSYII